MEDYFKCKLSFVMFAMNGKGFELNVFMPLNGRKRRNSKRISNKCSDMSMEVELPAHLGQYGRLTLGAKK